MSSCRPATRGSCYPASFSPPCVTALRCKTHPDLPPDASSLHRQSWSYSLLSSVSKPTLLRLPPRNLFFQRWKKDKHRSQPRPGCQNQTFLTAPPRRVLAAKKLNAQTFAEVPAPSSGLGAPRTGEPRLLPAFHAHPCSSTGTGALGTDTHRLQRAQTAVPCGTRLGDGTGVWRRPGPPGAPWLRVPSAGSGEGAAAGSRKAPLCSRQPPCFLWQGLPGCSR